MFLAYINISSCLNVSLLDHCKVFPSSLIAFTLNYFANIFAFFFLLLPIQHIPILATGAGKRTVTFSKQVTVTCIRGILSFQLKGTQLGPPSNREVNQPHIWETDGCTYLFIGLSLLGFIYVVCHAFLLSCAYVVPPTPFHCYLLYWFKLNLVGISLKRKHKLAGLGGFPKASLL